VLGVRAGLDPADPFLDDGGSDRANVLD